MPRSVSVIRIRVGVRMRNIVCGSRACGCPLTISDGRHNGVKLSKRILSCMVAALSAMQRRIGSPSSDESCDASRCSYFRSAITPTPQAKAKAKVKAKNERRQCNQHAFCRGRDRATAPPQLLLDLEFGGQRRQPAFGGDQPKQLSSISRGETP